MKRNLYQIKKYRECKLWAIIYEIYWDLRSAWIISLQEKTIVETILLAITDNSDVHFFDLYLMNIFMKPMKAERCTDIKKKLYGSFLWMGFNCLKARTTSRRQFTFYHYFQADTLLFICYCWRSKFIMKI